MKTALLVAAEPFELRWVPDRPDLRWIKAAGGPGPTLAGNAADKAGPGADIVVSIGLCGALDPSLQVGCIFVATHVNGTPCSVPAGSFARGPLLSVDRVVASAKERRELRARGALAVEMEAAGVQRRAAEWGRPFFCIRAVSDGADEEFVLDLNAARDGEGRFSVKKIMLQAVRRPFRAVPELIRLKRQSEHGAKRLGDFLAVCNF